MTEPFEEIDTMSLPNNYSSRVSIIMIIIHMQMKEYVVLNQMFKAYMYQKWDSCNKILIEHNLCQIYNNIHYLFYKMLNTIVFNMFFYFITFVCK